MNFFIRLKNRILTGIYVAFIKLGFRLKVIYEDPAMKDAPVQGIYICNHMTHLDGLLIRAIFNHMNMYSLVTSDWFDKGWARSLLFYEKCIPINRDDPGTEWIHQARAVFKEGGSISIFPEGHTSKCETMNEFRPGFLMLASFLKDIQIIPVATTGKYYFLFGPRKKVLVGRPIAFDRSKFSIDPEKMAQYADEFRTVVEQMQEKLRNGEV